MRVALTLNARCWAGGQHYCTGIGCLMIVWRSLSCAASIQGILRGARSRQLGLQNDRMVGSNKKGREFGYVRAESRASDSGAR
jgi:hypothetical protein